ncbi:MAG: type II toxin-antitoxin system RelE/ParE family toxin [Verrucomicrobia bacterium]|nr:type II toxin-antitoxin system RelE/ParE family toxin [Verrucomicrobiota bacterium]
MIVDYHPAFADDLAEAMRYYNAAVLGPGDDFEKEVFQTIDRIKANPYAYNKVYREVRRARLKRFKWYAVRFSFVESSNTLRILSVLHGARHPDYGKDRR